MKSSIVAGLAFAGALALALSVYVSAQAKEHTMTGCLKSGTEAKTYMVTDVEGTGPKSIGIVASTANLAPHVGHKIAVTGTAVLPQKPRRTRLCRSPLTI